MRNHQLFQVLNRRLIEDRIYNESLWQFPFPAAISLRIYFAFLHRNLDSAEKRHQPGSCLVDIDGPQEENDKAFSRPLLGESRSYFHFYINEEDQGKRRPDDKRGEDAGASARQDACDRPRGTSSSGMDELEEDAEETAGRRPLSGLIEECKTDKECAFFSEFNIPNFVNLEQSSTLGEDDLLYEASNMLERQSHSQDAHCDIH